MTSHSTENFDLNQWERSDQVLMEDFNADNAKIDEALKAAADERAELAARIEEKADQTALAAETEDRTTALNAVNTTLGKKGNCQIAKSSYKGNGKFGHNTPNKLTFSKVPMFVLVLGLGGYASFFAPELATGTYPVPASSLIDASWSGAALSWFASDAISQLNSSGITYYVFAFYKQD